MKKILKKVVITSSLILGLVGAVNVSADTIEPTKVEPKYTQSGPTIRAVKSYTFDKWATSSTQYNKRNYTYVNIPPSSRQTGWVDHFVKNVGGKVTWTRVYSYSGGY
ncbi:hypothetical protein [Lactobacillus apis]|uniref:hypothetical protein n=1 Tax=Lactobacillus apis TaxID=303541 RepID=UPI002740F06C|nr:hypothetical protein [Lactobacillus apis]WLS84513.1 hypothetical protein RAM13_05245 [Lactobacillus apis]